MKLHEKAKELGVKAKDLIKYLNDAGSDIRSPNQELSDIESLDADNMISSPESKSFKAEKLKEGIAVVIIDKKVEIRRIYLNIEDDVVRTELLEVKEFASAPQAFAHAEYCMSRIELGDFK